VAGARPEPQHVAAAIGCARRQRHVSLSKSKSSTSGELAYRITQTRASSMQTVAAAAFQLVADVVIDVTRGGDGCRACVPAMPSAR
jgi:hypothetical protein